MTRISGRPSMTQLLTVDETHSLLDPLGLRTAVSFTLFKRKHSLAIPTPSESGFRKQIGSGLFYFWHNALLVLAHCFACVNEYKTEIEQSSLEQSVFFE